MWLTGHLYALYRVYIFHNGLLECLELCTVNSLDNAQTKRICGFDLVDATLLCIRTLEMAFTLYCGIKVAKNLLISRV